MFVERHSFRASVVDYICSHEELSLRQYLIIFDGKVKFTVELLKLMLDIHVVKSNAFVLGRSTFCGLIILCVIIINIDIIIFVFWIILNKLKS